VIKKTITFVLNRSPTSTRAVAAPAVAQEVTRIHGPFALLCSPLGAFCPSPETGLGCSWSSHSHSRDVALVHVVHVIVIGGMMIMLGALGGAFSH